MKDINDTCKQYMEFRLGTQNYLIPLSCVERVDGQGETEESLPVLDFYKITEVPENQEKRKHVLVIRNTEERMGLLVQEVLGILEQEGRVYAIPREVINSDNNYLSSVLYRENRLPHFVWILDVTALYEKVDTGNHE